MKKFWSAVQITLGAYFASKCGAKGEVFWNALYMAIAAFMIYGGLAIFRTDDDER
jgi:hypothetical protein